AMLNEIPDAFDFRLLGEEVRETRPVWIIEATPRPGYHAKSSVARMLLPKFKFRAWIDKGDLNWTRLEAEAIDNVSWGVFLFRLSKGARLEMEQMRVNGEVWLPRHLRVSGSARLAWMKKNAEQELTFRNYRKFQADSSVVE